LLLNAVIFMRAVKISTGALGDLAGREQAVKLDNVPLALDPMRLDGVEPGARDRQIADEDAHAVPGLLDLLVVGADPGTDRPADIPGGVVLEGI
jgi:hypothetical protein